MALIRWNPETSLLPSLFSRWADFFSSDEDWPTLVPAVNISESSDKYSVEVAAPGFSKENFRVEVKNGYLTVSGEMKEEKADKQKGDYVRREFRYGSFSRAFMLPDDVDEAQINAHYSDGILHISAPKKREALSSQTAKNIAIE